MEFINICLASRRLFVYSLAIHLPLWSAKLIQNIVHFVVPRGITILDKLTYSYLWDESIPWCERCVKYHVNGYGHLGEPIQYFKYRSGCNHWFSVSPLPFMILPLYSAIEKLDGRLLEAARDLGANAVQRFFRVILPPTIPGIVAGCLLVLLPAMGMFYVADLLGGAKVLLVGNVIKSEFLISRNWPFGSAISIGLTILMALLIFVYYRANKLLNKKVELE